jgi:outer membrane protein TolC
MIFSRRKLRVVSLLIGFVSAALMLSCTPPDESAFQEYIGPLNRQREEQMAAMKRAARQNQEQAATSRPATSSAPAQGPLNITVNEAILVALENNRGLIVQRYNPGIKRTLEQQQLAAFDPSLTGSASFIRNRETAFGTGNQSLTQGYVAQAGLQEFLPTGTTLNFTGDTAINQFPDWNDPRYSTNFHMSATQSLMRGFGLDVNLADLRQARIATLQTEYDLRGTAETLVASTEEGYWDYALALRKVEIYQQSLAIAQQQLQETQERIRVGKLAPTELAASQATVAQRQEDLINARSTIETTRIQLLRLMSPPGENPLGREVTLSYEKVLPNDEIGDVEQHIQVAMRLRPDLNQARLQVNSDNLTIVQTKNGLLPQLDTFVNLGRTGYASSFGHSIGNFTDADNYGVEAGISSFQYTLGNRDARAAYTRSVFTRDQALESLSNLEQLAEVDVRLAFVEVIRSKEQIAATRATRVFQEEKLRAETERLRVGKSTTLLVSIAQNDLLTSQIAEVEAVVSYVKALVELYRLEGSLLERRGVGCPGDKPVTVKSKNWTGGGSLD